MRTVLALVVILAAACSTRKSEPAAGSVASASRKLANLKVARSGAGLLTLADGRLFIANGDDYPQNTAEIYDPKKDTWTRTADDEPHRDFAPVLLPDGRPAILVATSDNRGQLYDLSLDRWFATKGTAAEYHMAPTITPLAGGKFLIAGGIKPSTPSPYVASTAAELFDSATEMYSPAGTLLEARIGHLATALPDGRVLLIGGGPPGTFDALSTVERWDPTTKTFAKVASMNEPRTDAAMAKLPSGMYLVAGGSSGSGALSSVETYDPVADRWTYVKSMTAQRRNAFAAKLADGRVLVGGGYTLDAASTLSSTEIFDPVTATWSAGPSLANARSSAAVAVLSSGAVLIAGGTSSTGAVMTSVELLEPADLGLDAGTDAAPSDAPSSDASASDAAPAAEAGGAALTDPNYKACKNDGECSTGFCVDGVCCDTRCNDRCSSCSLPWAPGKCTGQPYGYDRRSECGPAGSCTATCDGKGACAPMRGGEQCAAAHCTDRSHGVGAATCTSAGAACPRDTAITFDCGAYACEAAFGACLSACNTSDQCADGHVCDTQSKTCVAAASDDAGGCDVGRGRAGAFSFLAALAVSALVARRRR